MTSPKENRMDPDEVLGTFWRWWKVWLTGLLLIAALVIGGWRAGWWFASQNSTRQAHLVQNNYNTQEGYISAISNDVATIDGLIAQEPGAPNAAQIRVQVLGVGNQACLEASYLTGSVPVPASMKAWIAANCSAGAVSPASPLRTGGN
jgi:hypothetical protein